MNFKMTKIAALAAMAFASPSVHAVLTSFNTLSIQNDAVTDLNPDTRTSTYIIVSNGSLLDSFFTYGGSKAPIALNTQYSFVYSGPTAMTLTGASQSNITTFLYYSAGGDNATNTVSMGTSGLSIISASGDSASINMSGLKMRYPNSIET